MTLDTIHTEGSCPDTRKLELDEKLTEAVLDAATTTADTLPTILRGPAEGSAQKFFATGWTK